MKFTKNVFVVVMMVMVTGISSYAADKKSDKIEVLSKDAVLLTIDAEVENINYETREVTLKDSEGKTVKITVEMSAGKLENVKKGDLVAIEYLESVEISLVSSDKLKAGVVGGAAVETSDPEKKPAKVKVAQVNVILTIEKIDLKNELVTLKDAQGNTETVKARNPENLKKGKVGDKVIITVTKAIGYKVTKKQ
ncbi:MAG: hypothetical protein DRH93_19140 [Deltaproteobacteria bacterium]|nr:MAG: hypothetical protein DRH93_19140 [Deltaproteobacteria bacterium]